jgi:hypothetical protein
MTIGTAEPKARQPAPGGVCLKGAGLEWLDHKDAKAGAAIAYYSIFQSDR